LTAILPGSILLTLLQRIWTGLWITAVIASVIVFLSTVLLGYTDFVFTTLRLINKEEHADLAFSFVTRQEYHLLQFVLLGWICGLIWLRFFFQHHSVAKSFLQFIQQGASSVWKSIFHTNAKYVLVIPLVCSLFYAITLPVTYDEAFTYVYFTRNSPLVSMSFYPSTNNHILFSLITNFTQYIPFVSPLLSIRLPSLIISLIAWGVLYHVYRQSASEKPALIFTAVVSMLFMSVYYSFMARGYALVMLFFILACYSMWRITKDNRATNHWILFTISSVLGCYAMPSYAYAWLSCCVLLAVYAHSGRKQLLMSISGTVIITALLYLPIFIVSGIESVINNKHLQGVPFHVFRSKVDSFWYQAIGEMTGLHTMLVLTLLGIGLLYMIMSRHWKAINMFLILVLTPVLILTYQSIIPFARTFAYLLPIILLVIAALYTQWLQTASSRIVLGIAIVLQLGLWFNFHRLIGPYDSVYSDYHQAAMYVLGDQQSYYFDSELFDTVLAFELETRGYKMQKATNFYPTIPRPMSADSITGHDYIIIDRHLDETKTKQPVFQTTRLNIYE
jgi:hypothetical protein